MKTYTSDEAMVEAHGGPDGDEWVRADVVRQLYASIEELIDSSHFMRDEYSDMDTAIVKAYDAMAAADGGDK